MMEDRGEDERSTMVSKSEAGFVAVRKRSKPEKALQRLEDLSLQWSWFALGLKPGCVGYPGNGERVVRGPLTWRKQRRHDGLRRRVHVCLLDYRPEGDPVSKLTAFRINERSKSCSASVNDRIEDADVVWVSAGDPLPPDGRRRLLAALEKAQAGAPVINHPRVHDAYHEEGVFEKLAGAGVNVPRSEFSEEDVSKVSVVYKNEGLRHGAPKFLSEYTGPRAGHRAFEFVDSRGSDGLYRKHRAFYIVGAVWPAVTMLGEHWNVWSGTAKGVEFALQMTPAETEQVRLIAKTLGFQFFAVDFVRRASDGATVFVDVNIQPDTYSKIRDANKKLGYYGNWHYFDDREHLKLPEPLGRSPWDVFDEAMLGFSRKSPSGPVGPGPAPP